jgi:hypothetical protein
LSDGPLLAIRPKRVAVGQTATEAEIVPDIAFEVSEVGGQRVHVTPTKKGWGL